MLDLTKALDKCILQYYNPFILSYADLQPLVIRTDIKKTLTPWSSVSMAVIRTPFSLALSTCIWGQSLVLRINRRLPWVLITGRETPKAMNYGPQQCSMAPRKYNGSPLCSFNVLQKQQQTINFIANIYTTSLGCIHLIIKHRMFKHGQTEIIFVGLPRRDCSVPSSVDAMSLSLSNPRPLSIHDWVVFSNTYNLHCIWTRSVTIKKFSSLVMFFWLWLLQRQLCFTCKTLLSDSSPVLTSTFSKMHFLAVALVYAAADSSKDSDTTLTGETQMHNLSVNKVWSWSLHSASH